MDVSYEFQYQLLDTLQYKDKVIILSDDYFTSKKDDQVQKAVDEIFDDKVKFILNNSWLYKKI